MFDAVVVVVVWWARDLVVSFSSRHDSKKNNKNYDFFDPH
jgi:hypothetical protein